MTAASPSASSGTVRVNKHKPDWRGWKFMWPFAVVFVLVFIIPIVYAIYISFFEKRMVGGTVFVGIDNYLRLFGDDQFWASCGRVALFTIVQVPIMLFLSAVMALCIDSMKLHGAKFFRISTFLPYRGAGGGLHDDLGLHVRREVRPGRVAERPVGHEPGRAVAERAFGLDRQHRDVGVVGYNMLIFYSSLSTIPHSLYEAASIDGASEWQIVKSIKIPELKGSLAITVIFSIIGSFQLFNEPNILQNMVPGNAITTYYTPNMYAYNLSFSGNQSNYAAAMAIVMAVITMAIAYAVQLNSMKEQIPVRVPADQRDQVPG